LVLQYLNIPLMRDILNQARNHIDKQITQQIGTIFLRGLMAGLFLLRFDS